MTNKYASQDLYSLGIREPLSKEELYNLHGFTDYPTDVTSYNKWYDLTATSWLDELTYDTLYDSSTEKYFIKDHYNSSELNSCWMTLQDQAAGAFKDENTRWARVSPTNNLSDRPLYKSDIAAEVPAIQFDPTDTSKPTLYYVHPNYINGEDLGWHTEDELVALGYSFDTFDEVGSPLFFKNTGDTSATVKLKMVGTVNNADYETSSDGISWQPYAVTADPATITLQPNDRIFFRGRKDVSTGYNCIQFSITGHVEAYGNVNSLLNKTAYKDLLDISDCPYAFTYLFSTCRGLYRAPVLPAITLSASCYYFMFNACSNLVEPPELPAVNLASSCYYTMFWACTSLESMPRLPATTLASQCYRSMFSRCTSLVTAHDLPASKVTNYCYSSMFYNCTSLINAPNILATELSSHAISGMFNGCTSLNSVRCKIITDTITSDAANWLKDVSSTGTFYCNDLNCWELDSPNGIPNGWEAFVEMPLCFVNKDTSNATIKLSNYIGSGGTALAEKEYEYSTDSDYTSDNWYAYNFTGNEGETLTIPPNSHVYFKGHRSSQTSNSYMQFEILSGKVYAYGNVNSMCLSDFSTNNSLISTGLRAFIKMFLNNSNLYRVPSLPSTAVTSECYYSMFSACTKLTDTANLPSKSLAQGSYAGMFSQCTSIVNTSYKLPATSLAPYCYHTMFSTCTSLTKTPNLPATNLSNSCYYAMFSRCTSLQSTPILLASKLKTGCYGEIFRHCTSLNEVHTHAETVEEGVSSYSSLWLDDVASTGKFYYYADIWTLNSSSGIPSGWSAYCEKPLCFTNVGNSDATIKLSAVGSTDLHPVYEISRDGSEWESYTMNSDITLNDSLGNTVFFKGSRDTQNYYNYLQFITGSSGEIEVSGNVNSMLSNDTPVFSEISDLLSYDSHTYFRLFYSCGNITTPPLLTATKLTWGCYHSMFYQCTALLEAPKLPAMTLAGDCYSHMFSNCTSLRIPPEELPAMTCSGGCYQAMFYGCTSLQKTPSLPATTLGTACYSNMFSYCSSLTTNVMNSLPAQTLKDSCYQYMFYECTLLTKAPELPAKTLAASCYANMFDGCTLLNEVKCYAINTSASNCTSNMLNGVASNGTFYCEAVPEYMLGVSVYALIPLPQWYDKNVIPNSWSTVITKEHYTGFLAQDGLPTNMTANTDYQLYWLNDNSNACPLVNAYAKYQSLFADNPDAFTVESIDSSYSPSISAVDSSGNISARVGTGMSNISKVDYCIDVTNISNY